MLGKWYLQSNYILLVEKHNTTFLVYVEGILSNKISPWLLGKTFWKAFFLNSRDIQWIYARYCENIYVCLRAKHFWFKCHSILPMIGAYFKNIFLRMIYSFNITLSIIYKNIQRNFLLYSEGTLCLWIFFLEKKRWKVIHLLKGEMDLTPLGKCNIFSRWKIFHLSRLKSKTFSHHVRL